MKFTVHFTIDLTPRNLLSKLRGAGGYSPRLLLICMLAMTVVFTAGCKKGEVIEEIGDYTITTADFDMFYSASLERTARLGNIEKPTLYKMICNKQNAPNRIYKEISWFLKPENYYKRYREHRIVDQVARKAGFHERPVVQNILNLLALEMIAQLYIQEKLEERIKITDEQKHAKCEQMRKRYPDRIGTLPLDQCLLVAQGQLKQEVVEKETEKIVDEIKESVVVHRNPDFNRDEFLKDGFELFQTIRKEGGCSPEDEAAKPAGGEGDELYIREKGDKKKDN